MTDSQRDDQLQFVRAKSLGLSEVDSLGIELKNLVDGFRVDSVACKDVGEEDTGITADAA